MPALRLGPTWIDPEHLHPMRALQACDSTGETLLNLALLRDLPDGRAAVEMDTDLYPYGGQPWADYAALYPSQGDAIAAALSHGADLWLRHLEKA